MFRLRFASASPALNPQEISHDPVVPLGRPEHENRRIEMGAKQKLNSANAVLALVIAAIMGMAFGSWIAFVVAAIILVAASVVSGDIRR